MRLTVLFAIGVFSSFIAGVVFHRAGYVFQIKSWWAPALQNEGVEANEIHLSDRTFVILVAGQSNAANFGQLRLAAGKRAFAFHRGRLFPCIDPLPGAGGDGGSPWPALAEMIVSRTNERNVIVSNVSQGSTSVLDWLPGGELFSSALIEASDLRKLGTPVDCFVWLQGETDAINRIEEATYKNSFTRMIAALRSSGENGAILVCVTSRNGDLVSEPVRNAQKSVVQELPHVFLGIDTDQLGESYRYDGVHFNLSGLEAIAAGIYESLIREQIISEEVISSSLNE